jgi:hypothetical protein
LLFFFSDLLNRIKLEAILKKFLKVGMWSLCLLSAMQSCSGLGKTGDKRPSWMGGEEEVKE